MDMSTARGVLTLVGIPILVYVLAVIIGEVSGATDTLIERVGVALAK